MADSTTVRIPKRIYAILSHHIARMQKTRGVEKTPSQMTAAALVYFAALTADQQLQLIYDLERNLDEIEAIRDADAVFARGPGVQPKADAGQRRRKTGMPPGGQAPEK